VRGKEWNLGEYLWKVFELIFGIKSVSKEALKRKRVWREERKNWKDLKREGGNGQEEKGNIEKITNRSIFQINFKGFGLKLN